MIKNIPAGLLKELFECDSDRGLLRWKNPTAHQRKGWFSANLGGLIHFRGHRLRFGAIIWVLSKGQWSVDPYMIHLNGDRTDNRLENLLPGHPGDKMRIAHRNRKEKNRLTSELVKKLFYYDHEEGTLVRACDWYNAKAGPLSKSNERNGYARVEICGKIVALHNLIWMWHYGEIPAGYSVDHKDRNKSNNRIDNLRLATRHQNTRNHGLLSSNTSGVTGVEYRKDRDRWVSKINQGGKQKTLGYFREKEEAIRVRKDAEIREYGEFAPCPS